jgi:hypothetical protein
MFCTACGKRALNREAAFCAFCGHALDGPVLAELVSIATPATPAAEYAGTPTPSVGWPAEPVSAWAGPTQRPRHAGADPAAQIRDVGPRTVLAHVVLWGGLALAAIVGSIRAPSYRAVSLYAGSSPAHLLVLNDFDAAAFVAFLATALLLPASALRRFAASSIVLVVGAIWTLTADDIYYEAPATTLLLVPAGFAALLAAWLLLRQRRGLAYLLLIPVVLAAAVTFDNLNGIGLIVAALIPFAIVGGCGLIAAKLPRSADSEAPVTTAEYTSTGHAGGPAPQNTLAVIAFVLSFFFSLPAIVCGHAALGQIRKTRERGRGLAIGALVIGYTALTVLVLVVVLVAVNRANGA